MLSSDDHSGLITFVFGLIVVVFAGIALSLVVDRRFSFSSSVTAMEAEIRSNESELERLKQVCTRRNRRPVRPADTTPLHRSSRPQA